MLPNSINPLVSNGVLAFDPDAYLAGGVQAPAGFSPYGSPKMKGQPQKDSFLSSVQKNSGTIKTVAAAAIVATLGFFGFKKLKGLLK